MYKYSKLISEIIIQPGEISLDIYDKKKLHKKCRNEITLIQMFPFLYDTNLFGKWTHYNEGVKDTES